MKELRSYSKLSVLLLGVFLISCGGKDTENSEQSELRSDGLSDSQTRDYDLKEPPEQLSEYFIDTEWTGKDVDVDEAISNQSFMSVNGRAHLPRTIASLGDSITRGALAAYKRKHLMLPWITIEVFVKGASYLALNSVKVFDNPGLSWSSGLGIGTRRKVGRTWRTVRKFPVNSHALRLQRLAARKIESYNASKNSYDSQLALDELLPQLLNHSNEQWRQDSPDYTTVMLGANDVCADTDDEMTSTEDYYSNMNQIMTTLLTARTDSKVMMVSPPDVISVRERAQNSTMLGVGSVGLKCRDVWKVVGYCKNILRGRNLSRPKERLNEYNLAMQELSGQLKNEFGDRFRYSDISQQKITPSDLSFDCFHPNVDGHNKLAEETWKSSWWR